MSKSLSQQSQSQKRLSDAVRDKSTLQNPTSLPYVYRVSLKEERFNKDGVKLFSFGELNQVDAPKRRCTILLVGATGSGKSALINGMINYILGVKWEDSYRFTLVDDGSKKPESKSQTSDVTVYKLYHQAGFNIDYSLKIVDTPGFGDTRGIERDRQITKQLQNAFSDMDGISIVNAVCFVVSAPTTRLTATQMYIFDSILSIFGKDIAENIRLLITFADNETPPVLEVIKDSGIPCPKDEDGKPAHFIFNNSAFFAKNISTANNSGFGSMFSKMFWDLGMKSLEEFFDALSLIEPKSLFLSREVLREREELEISIDNLQEKIKLGLAKIWEISETEAKLRANQGEIVRNMNFEFYVTVKQKQKKNCPRRKFSMNCGRCQVTCHYPCTVPNKADKKRCKAIGKNGRCRQCKGKCPSSAHVRQNFKWTYIDVVEKKTANDLKQNYEKATGQKVSYEGLITKQKSDLKNIEDEVMELIQESTNCRNKLTAIALKPNPLFSQNYIELLIENEKNNTDKPGWEDRLQSLMRIQRKAELMAKVNEGERDLQALRVA